jgi:hypothetical protein
MRHSLHSHIIYLENTIQDLKNSLTRAHLCIEEFEDLQLQLATAESALTHYRQAYELELSVAGSEPPSQPDGAQSDGGAGRQEISKPEKKKNGLRARKRARLIPPPSRILRIPHHTAPNGSRRARPTKV